MCQHIMCGTHMQTGLAKVASLGPRPFSHLRNKYRKWGVGKNEGKDLAHQVGLARQMEYEHGRNMHSCQTTNYLISKEAAIFDD